VSKWKRKYLELLKMSKKTVCIPAHLTDELSKHVARQAFERAGQTANIYVGWSF
jgi:hypothetical protein